MVGSDVSDANGMGPQGLKPLHGQGAGLLAAPGAASHG